MAKSIGQPRKRVKNGMDVLTASVKRMEEIYAEGHRVVVSFSGGKDSTILLEVCAIAATNTNRLPVEVVYQDEEIVFPGTHEFVERTANRHDVELNWLLMEQPGMNCYNRASPYWWAFDRRLDSSEWVSTPPEYAQHIDDKSIIRMTHPDRFPPEEGKNLYAAIGLRTAESRGRLLAIFSSRGHLTKPMPWGTHNVRPVYDWNDGSVWKFIKEFDLDYNKAYDVFMKLGCKGRGLRIGPPTMNPHGAGNLQRAAAAWPQWFEKVCGRLDGVRNVVNYGKRVIQPNRRNNETWEQCFWRECVEGAPDWIAERAKLAVQRYTTSHSRHATTPFPEVKACGICSGAVGSWKKMTHAMWNGDPHSFKARRLKMVEPEFFREDAGKWFGPASW